MSDWMLSGEFIPAADLKKDRSLGELYVTGMVYENGKLWAVSKNFNVLLRIDVLGEKVEAVYGLPAEFTDIRGLGKRGNLFDVVDKNRIVTFELTQQ